MIDTHAHIYLPEFDADRQAMLERARAQGVEAIYLPNIDVDSITSMHALAEAHPQFCFPMMGLHPCSVQDDFAEVLDRMEHMLQEHTAEYYGVGECGLDYYWDKSRIPQQKAAFERQILMAKKFQLPLIIHSRDAMDDCIEMVAKHQGPDLRGIFHCFGGTAEQLQRITEMHFHAGIGGVATYKKGGLDLVLKPEHLPWLVLETDAPYLTPVPHRGKRNEPAYLTYIVERLAQILQIDVQQVRHTTTQNARALFGKK